ncbi:hypothetical protein LTR97_012750 [Elasticomyces elasticus]|uniref:Uncharacterized protein n=1 Tax=Elasticomyces elasticus TaxID=574655 RepID=A0AAN7ZYK3_9PEZI|nr:hypothetical protein LTR97_012750 [Elasticomyces elasticus]
MYLAKHTDALSHSAVEAYTTTPQPSQLPTAPTGTEILVARNHIDESDAINIVFGMLALVVAIFALCVGIYYGRQQALRLAGAWSQWRWPRLRVGRPNRAGTGISLDQLARNEPSHVAHRHVNDLGSPPQRDSAIGTIV